MSAALEYSFFAMLLAGATTAQASPDFEPGLWETRVETQMVGAPMAIPPVSHRECITREHLIPKTTQQPDAGCTVIDHRISGNTVRWHLRCDHEGARIESNGTVIYAGESFKGQVLSRVRGDPQGTMKMTQNLTGHRLGPCP